jgi:hypothetical protein
MPGVGNPSGLGSTSWPIPFSFRDRRSAEEWWGLHPGLRIRTSFASHLWTNESRGRTASGEAFYIRDDEETVAILVAFAAPGTAAAGGLMSSGTASVTRSLSITSRGSLSELWIYVGDRCAGLKFAVLKVAQHFRHGTPGGGRLFQSLVTVN